MKRLFTILALTFTMFSFGQQCVADFSYTIDSNAMTIEFQDFSWSYDSINGQAVATSWSWDVAGTNYSTSTFTYNYTSLPILVCLTANFDNGCSDTFCDTVDVTITDPCANFYIDAGYDFVDLSACDGELTASVYSGTAPYTFDWGTFGNTQTISNLCEGNYPVTVVDANGCSLTATGSVEVDTSSNNQILDSLYNPAIDTCLDFIPTSVFVNNVTLLDSFTVAVEWLFFGPNQEMQIVTETYSFSGAYGNYAVSISIDCGTKTIQTWGDVILIDMNTPMNIKEIDTINSLNLYPNPVKDVLNIDFNTNENNTLNVQVISYTGQVMYNLTINTLAGNNTITINTNDLNSGIYFVRINDKTMKFVK